MNLNIAMKYEQTNVHTRYTMIKKENKTIPHCYLPIAAVTAMGLCLASSVGVFKSLRVSNILLATEAEVWEEDRTVLAYGEEEGRDSWLPPRLVLLPPLVAPAPSDCLW